MQRQRIVKAMRLRLARRNATDSEPDLVPGFRVDDQHLPVQFEQGVQGRIALHQLSLSHTDKEVTKKTSFPCRDIVNFLPCYGVPLCPPRAPAAHYWDTTKISAKTLAGAGLPVATACVAAAP